MSEKKEEKLDLKPLKRFLNSKDEFKLTKIASKRAGSYVGVGQYERGEFVFYKYPKTDKLPAATGVAINGHGLTDYMRTSPIVKIVDHDKDSTTFETEGGVYKLERYNGP